jgi:sterol desaturase/sphingolipid hydroxylase (fatty acid hydroxylase superfamily)
MADMAMLVVLLSYVAFILVDIFKPARKYEEVRHWRWVGIAATLVLIPFNVILSETIAARLKAANFTALDLSALPVVPTAVGGWMLMTLIAYGFHRTFHQVPLLWRWTHQLHHSAERMDIFGAFYFHPNEIAVQVALSTPLLALLGLSPEQAGVMGAIGLFAAILQHANLNTPTWLAIFMQRPEAHAVHHERGVHAFNYSDFPLWDVLFGTFKNPARHEAPAGFYLGSSYRVLDMLMGRDVGTPAKETESAPEPALSRRAA